MRKPGHQKMGGQITQKRGQKQKVWARNKEKFINLKKVPKKSLKVPILLNSEANTQWLNIVATKRWETIKNGNEHFYPVFVIFL